MKTTSILAATVAAFLLVSGPSFAAEPQQPQALTQTQAPTEAIETMARQHWKLLRSFAILGRNQ